LEIVDNEKFLVFEGFDFDENIFPGAHMQKRDFEVNNKYYVDKESSNVVHLIFAKHQSEAGCFFNTTSVMILSSVIASQPPMQIFNFETSLLSYMERTLPKYFGCKDDIKNSLKLTPGEKCSIEMTRGGYAEFDTKVLKLDTNGMVDRVHSLQDDLEYIKDYISSENSDLPNAFVETPEDFVWFIEVPGTREEDISKSEVNMVNDTDGFYFIISSLYTNSTLKDYLQKAKHFAKSNLLSIRSGDILVKTPKIKDYRIREFGKVSKELKDGILILKWAKNISIEGDF